MAAYYDEVQKLEERFDGLELHILRRDNLAAGTLAKIASSKGPAPLGVFINDAHEPSVRAIRSDDQTMGAASKAVRPPSLMVIDQVVTDTRSDWTTPFIE